jgi:hypothetical protein
MSAPKPVHLGQADILREGIDGAAGLRAGMSNLPEDLDRSAYVDKLTALAERFWALPPGRPSSGEELSAPLSTVSSRSIATSISVK